MKNLFFSLIALLLFTFTSNSQSVRDFLVKSQTTVTKTSKDGFYLNNVSKLVLPSGIKINGENFQLYTLNDSNFQMIEIPVLSDTKIVNLLFVVLDVKLNKTSVIYKNHQKEIYTFYSSTLEKQYDIKFSNGTTNFTNYTGKVDCYYQCRSKAWRNIESDFLSDFACSFNPCGAAIALYCAGLCY
jgi:hypothetical protein